MVLVVHNSLKLLKIEMSGALGSIVTRARGSKRGSEKGAQNRGKSDSLPRKFKGNLIAYRENFIITNINKRICLIVRNQISTFAL